MSKPYGRTHETRACWWCRVLFVADHLDIVFCSAICGRAFRGCDAQGRPLKRVS
jgi:hypothetical protein